MQPQCEEEKTVVETETPIDAHLLAIHLDGWNIDPEDQPFIKFVKSVFLFNSNEITHCCELTPSYWLIHVYDAVVFTEKGKKLDDDKRVEMYDKYENCDEEDMYVHCYEIDEIIRKKRRNKRWYKYIGKTGVSFEDTNREDQMESLREHYAANPPIW